MSYYLRKAFALGPVRINLSKHGAGFSLGLKGARLGVSSDGRVYTHAGRYGLYHRQYYGRFGHPGGPARGRAEAPHMGRGPGAVGQTLALHIDTGVTYGPTTSPAGTPSQFTDADPSARAPTHALREQLRRQSSTAPHGAFFLVVAGCGLAALLLGFPRAIAPITLAALAALGWVAAVARARHITARGDAFNALLQDTWPDAHALDPPALARQLAALDATGATPGDRRRFVRIAYLAMLQSVIRDGILAPDETTCLTQMADALDLPASFTGAAYLEVFREVYLEAVADHELTPEEEDALASIRTGLGIPVDDVSVELSVIDRLRTVRAIRSGSLPTVKPSISLRADELCHYEGEGRLLKEKVLGRFQRDGTRYKQVGFVVAREGTLRVTSARLFIVGSGMSEIRLDRMLGLEIDLDRNLITFTLDGRVRPVFVTTPDALEVSAMVATLRGM